MWCFQLAQLLAFVYYMQNSADELYLMFEQFCDYFHTTSRNSLYMNFISSHSNNIHAREQLRCVKNKTTSSSQVKFHNQPVTYYALLTSCLPLSQTSNMLVSAVCEEDASLTAY